MFTDVGPLEVVTLVILAIVIFGPDKLPKLIQDVMGFVRKVRTFADSAKEDIRSELGPEFKDFDFEDLNPKTFVRKQLLGGNEDPLGFKEIRDGLDIKSVLNDDPAPSRAVADLTKSASPLASPIASPVAADPLQKDERPPFDPDAT
ncbi:MULTISPECIES: sec-independent translocase [unclassified Kitasatospora]|uniref:sec-independent translocase n=1 Tax=unclassified Kitasatospora TaxID=2633591 RepID=UPI00070DA48F|nr:MULTISPECIES: sec-independent translocase [unclassified Kitasatospora]KQV23858.1 preprotein translocase [Kitasatospora sp. Root107]KRB67430.1 preprotein translocase [Kitasatospora sp. Root187]